MMYAVANPGRGHKDLRRPTVHIKHGGNPRLKPTGIQIAIYYSPGPTAREHREHIHVETMQAFQVLSYKLQREKIV